MCQVLHYALLNKFDSINSFVRNVPFLYPPKTENRKVFLYFQRIEKGCIRNKRVNQDSRNLPPGTVHECLISRMTFSDSKVFSKIKMLK